MSLYHFLCKILKCWGAPLRYVLRLGFNSRDPGSILARDESLDIFENSGISRFDFSLIEICVSMILPINTQE